MPFQKCFFARQHEVRLEKWRVWSPFLNSITPCQSSTRKNPLNSFSLVCLVKKHGTYSHMRTFVARHHAEINDLQPIFRLVIFEATLEVTQEVKCKVDWLRGTNRICGGRTRFDPSARSWVCAPRARKCRRRGWVWKARAARSDASRECIAETSSSAGLEQSPQELRLALKLELRTLTKFHLFITVCTWKGICCEAFYKIDNERIPLPKQFAVALVESLDATRHVLRVEISDLADKRLTYLDQHNLICSQCKECVVDGMEKHWK